ncbi:UNVERIFIED_CONTAM: hypothetical protein RMT77_008447 [Armadillidium vulgare]
MSEECSSTLPNNSDKESVTCELNSSKGTKPNHLTNLMVDLEGLSVRQATATFASTTKSLDLRAGNLPLSAQFTVFDKRSEQQSEPLLIRISGSFRQDC